MPNPTGTQFLHANPNYVWTDGDVYAIAQTDATEGAALNASFGGLGVENQPHQALLNKINFLKTNLNQSSSNVGANGYYKVITNDSLFGSIAIIEQWGMIPASQVPPISAQNEAVITFNFSIAFTTACFVILPFIALSTSGSTSALIESIAIVLPVAPFNTNSNTLLLGWNSGQANFNNVVYGIGWRAVGY